MFQALDDVGLGGEKLLTVYAVSGFTFTVTIPSALPEHVALPLRLDFRITSTGSNAAVTSASPSGMVNEYRFLSPSGVRLSPLTSIFVST